MVVVSGGLTYKHYKHVLGAPGLQGPPSSAGVSFYTYILSRFIRNMSEITRREQSGSDPSYTPAGPCPLRALPARRVAPRDRVSELIVFALQMIAPIRITERTYLLYLRSGFD